MDAQPRLPLASQRKRSRNSAAAAAGLRKEKDQKKTKPESFSKKTKRQNDCETSKCCLDSSHRRTRRPLRLASVRQARTNLREGNLTVTLISAFYFLLSIF